MKEDSSVPRKLYVQHLMAEQIWPHLSWLPSFPVAWASLSWPGFQKGPSSWSPRGIRMTPSSQTRRLRGWPQKQDGKILETPSSCDSMLLFYCFSAPSDNSPQICTRRDCPTLDLQSLPQGQFSHSIKILNMHTLWPNDSTSRKIACRITHVDTQRCILCKDVHCIIVLKSRSLEVCQLPTIKGSDK